jgi:hypothetical protein
MENLDVLNLELHRFTVKQGKTLTHFTNLALAVVTGYLRKNRQGKGYTVQERGNPAHPISDYRVENDAVAGWSFRGLRAQ